MIKKIIPALAVLAGVLTVALLAIQADSISYGVLYIENDTAYDMAVTAKITTVSNLTDLNKPPLNTPTPWVIEAGGAEKIDVIDKLSDIRFKPVIYDDSKAPEWLKKETRLFLKPHEPAKELIVTLTKDPYEDRWLVKQKYVSSAKINYEKKVGGQIEILAQ